MLIRKEFFIFRHPQGLKFNLEAKESYWDSKIIFWIRVFRLVTFGFPKSNQEVSNDALPKVFGRMSEKSRLKISKKDVKQFFPNFPPRFSTYFAKDILGDIYIIRKHSATSWEFRSHKSKNLNDCWVLLCIFYFWAKKYWRKIWIFTERFDFGSFEKVKGDAFEGMPKTWSLIRLIKIH